ncbi:hypothetical protein BV25DRAFT_1639831 [Artomyces pyxidatus]|uniref:Uncharacterized protein n=1 Tax=Artomyces pyxidatus TaxID=48021 RepID=A0ACB8SJ73_9AGAM|nr:hypothetical protein BV25DRAFT_1639831 [Artomyces pyxidatus]
MFGVSTSTAYKYRPSMYHSHSVPQNQTPYSRVSRLRLYPGWRRQYISFSASGSQDRLRHWFPRYRQHQGVLVSTRAEASARIGEQGESVCHRDRSPVSVGLVSSKERHTLSRKSPFSRWMMAACAILTALHERRLVVSCVVLWNPSNIGASTVPALRRSATLLSNLWDSRDPGRVCQRALTTVYIHTNSAIHYPVPVNAAQPLHPW